MLSHHDVFGSDSDSDNEVDADASRSPGAATTASDRRADEIISRGEELLAKLAAGENSPSEVSESNQELDQEKSNAEEDGEEEESSDVLRMQISANTDNATRVEQIGAKIRLELELEQLMERV